MESRRVEPNTKQKKSTFSKFQPDCCLDTPPSKSKDNQGTLKFVFDDKNYDEDFSDLYGNESVKKEQNVSNPSYPISNRGINFNIYYFRKH